MFEGWWRREGRRVKPYGIGKAFAEMLETLIIGTGYYGFMKVPAETTDWVRSRGVMIIVVKTAEACKAYNSLSNLSKAAAALHLTF